MAKLIGCGSVLTATLLIASCTGSSSPPAALPSKSETVTSQSPTASPTESASATLFASQAYGYTLSLPASWHSIQAQKAWDGKPGALSSDSAVVDQFPGTYNASSWALAARSTLGLPAYTRALIASNARYHSDTCPAKPATRQRISIGGSPGVLLEYNCGILINLATAVHHGIGYMFGFRDPTVSAASDPADHATFLALLESVQFPD